MKDKIYKDWQDGMTLAELSETYFLTVNQIRAVLDKTPRERKCKYCGKDFTVSKKNKYCSYNCKKAYVRKVKPVPKPKIKSLEEIHLECERLSRERGEYVSYGKYMAMMRCGT